MSFPRATHLPLHRQETISARDGFAVPRSTQAGWLREAYARVHRVVAAMFADARATAHCIATDATGARVRVKGARACAGWHVFVFLADRDHIVFDYGEHHTGAFIRAKLAGFRGYLLLDAATIYDDLFSPTVIEVGCWAHLRRYVWKALPSEPHRATAWLAILGQLFEADRATRALPMPARTYERARRALPILAIMEAWIDRELPTLAPRTPLRAAVTYFTNQKLALHRFLEDGALRLDNNESEGALRKRVLGEHYAQRPVIRSAARLGGRSHGSTRASYTGGRLTRCT